MRAGTKKGAKPARSEGVSVRLDPKIRYLADVASRYHQRSISSFIEQAVRKALADPHFLEEDSSEPSQQQQDQPVRLRFEELWDVDESDRFYLLAFTRGDLLNMDEQRLWKFFRMHMEHTRQEMTIEAFREFWNSPDIDTTHLTKKTNEAE